MLVRYLAQQICLKELLVIGFLFITIFFNTLTPTGWTRFERKRKGRGYCTEEKLGERERDRRERALTMRVNETIIDQERVSNKYWGEQVNKDKY